MPVGFQSFTDNGVLQIDAEKKCYVLVASGIVTTGISGSAILIRSAAGAASRMIFFQEGDWFYSGSADADSVGVGPGEFAYFVGLPTATSGVSIRWYEFDVISADVGATFGFQLKNAANELTFDAAQRPLLPYGVVANVKPSTAPSLSINTARTYAIHMPAAPYRYTYVTTVGKVGFVGTYESCKMLRSGSNLTFPAFTYLTNTPGFASNFEQAGVSAIVIDVHDFIAT